MKYFFTVMGALCVWLFIVIIIDFNDLLDMPMFVYALVLALMIVSAHILAAKRYGNPGPEDANSRIMLKLFVAGFLVLVGTIAAALGFSAAINPDYRAELSAPFVTCGRDDSKVETLNVNKQITLDGGAIMVHSVTTNVPQSAKNPQPYSYTCQKAVLADVSIMSNNGSTEMPAIRDLELITASKPNGIAADEINSTSQFESYADSKKLSALRQSRFGDSRSQRGWVAFPMQESEMVIAKGFVYDKYGQNKSIDLN